MEIIINTAICLGIIFVTVGMTLSFIDWLIEIISEWKDRRR